MANEVETLDVHFGKKHSDKNQCGLCDKTFDTSKLLDDHLTQCKICMCSKSGCRESFGKLADMRKHISNEHRKN